MNLRIFAALCLFASAAYYGIQGVRVLMGSPDGSSSLVGLIYASWGVVGSALAAKLAFGKGRAK
nr:hypothetical protein [uncultured Albidiferax sp.]